MSIAARASINAGADQSGKITIVDGDVVQPKLADYTGVGTILWEIISFPSGFSTPSGWTAATGRFYWQGSAATGYVPPSIDFTSAPWGLFWFRVTIDNGISGDTVDLDETRDETLAVEILGPSSMRDVPVTDNSLAIPGETFRLVWGAIQANLRIIAPVLLPAGTVEGQACRWNNTSGAWEAATGVVIGGSYIALGGNAPSTVGLNLSNGESIQGYDAYATERRIAKVDPTTGNLLLGMADGSKQVDCQGNELINAPRKIYSISTDSDHTLDYTNGDYQVLPSGVLSTDRNFTLPSGVADGRIFTFMSLSNSHAVYLLGASKPAGGSDPTIVYTTSTYQCVTFRRISSAWQLESSAKWTW